MKAPTLIAGLCLLLVIAFGCVTPPAVPMPEVPQGITPATGVTCTNVTTQTPYTVPECVNVTYTEEECSLKELPYAATPVEKIYLCINRDLCLKYDNAGKCIISDCSYGMLRCRFNITNKDRLDAGTWEVSGMFTLGSTKFDKNPASVDLDPGETEAISFEQFYSIDYRQLQPDCDVHISKVPKATQCINVARHKMECSNVTLYRTTVSEACK